ncbi:polyprotein [Currant latent virus]|uniref:Polyprotein n=1 Tax=Currant latent virus TaxID=1476584 RepID=A0A0U2TYG1_9SECO|nr:polyprotein [Currant latent virus]ALT45950.1 polyprotein [Currant latent virus]
MNSYNFVFGSFDPLTGIDAVSSFEEYYSSPAGPMTRFQARRIELACLARARAADAAAQAERVQADLRLCAASMRELQAPWMLFKAPATKSLPAKSVAGPKRESQESLFLRDYGRSLCSPLTSWEGSRVLQDMEHAVLAKDADPLSRALQARALRRAAFKARCRKRAFKAFMEECKFLSLPVQVVSSIPITEPLLPTPEAASLGTKCATSRRQSKCRRSFSSFLPKEDFSFVLGPGPVSDTEETGYSSGDSVSSLEKPSDSVSESSPRSCSHGITCRAQFCFGYLDFRNEINASRYLNWLLQTQLPGGITCFELPITYYLEHCTDTMEAIDLWWHVMDRHCANFKPSKHRTPFEFHAKNAERTIKAKNSVPSRQSLKQQMLLEKSQPNWEFLDSFYEGKRGEGPWQFVKDKVRCAVDGTYRAFTLFVNKILHSLNPLVIVLGPFKQTFFEVFNNLKENCYAMLQKHWLAAAVGASLVLGFLFLLAVICICKVFTFLVSQLGLPVVTLSFLVTGLFVLFFTVNGFLEQAADVQLCALVADDFIRFLSQNKSYGAVAGIVADLQEDAKKGQGITWCFQALYKLISRLVPSGAKETVALFNSIGSLSRSANHGKDFFINMKEMVVSWMDAFHDALALLGDDSVTAIHTLKYLCEEDFLDWAKKVERYAVDTYDSMVISPCERLKILRLLVDKQERLTKAFFHPRIARSAPRLMLNEFTRLSTLLRDAHNALSRASLFDQRRIPPFWVHLYSEKGGTGKSMATLPLGNYLLDVIEEPQSLRFVTRNVASKFLNGYLHQPCFVMDEFGAHPTQDYSDEVTMLDLVGPNPLTLNMAALGDKNIMFNSKLIISNGNRRLPHPEVKLGANLDGFLRRRHVLVEVVRVEDKPHFNEYILLQPRTQDKLYLDKAFRPCVDPVQLTPDEFYAVCAEQFMTHLNREGEVIQQHTGVYHVRSNDFDFLRDYLMCKLNLGLDVDEVERIVTSYAHSTKGETIFPIEHEHIFEAWKAELESLTLSELISMLDKKVTETFVYTLIKNDSSNVLISDLTPYECLIYQFCKLKYKSETDAQFPSFEAKEEKLPWYIEFISFCAKLVSQLPKWLILCVALCAVLLVGYTLIKFALYMFSGALTLLGVLSFSNLSGQGPEDSPGFDNARKTQGIRVKWEDRPAYGKAYIPPDQDTFASQEEFNKYWTSGLPSRWSDYEGQGPSELDQSVINLLKHQVVFINDMTKVVYNAIALGGRNFLITKHVFDLMPVANYSLYGYAITKPKIWIDNRVRPKIQLKDRDLVIVEMPLTVPCFSSLPKDIFLKNMQEAPKQVNAVLVIAEPNYEGKSVAKLVQKFQPFTNLPQVHAKDTYSCGSLGSLRMPPCYSYTFDTYPGLCTSPLICMSGGRCILLGLHVVGNMSKTGFSQIVTLDDFSEVPLQSGTLVGEGPECYCIPTASSECYGSVTKLGKWTGPAPYFLEKTSLVPSMISKDIDIEMTTEPAILTTKDPRLAHSNDPDFNPFKAGMLKYAVEAHGFNEDEEFFEDALDRVFSEIPDFNCQELADDEVCNGIEDDPYAEPLVMQTSEGYPFCTQRPAGATGKSWLFCGSPGDWHILPGSLLHNEMNKMERNLSQGIFEPVIGIDFPKDEKVDKSKVYIKPKTRLFTILPVHYNILVRKYFLSFVSQLMALHNETPTKVGINPLSNEWGILQFALSAKGENWFNGDYSRFDGITPRSVLLGIVKRISNRFVNKNSLAITDKTLSINGDLARSLLMDMASTRYGLTQGDLWYVNSGIPSGFPLTVIVNSLVNSFFIHYAYMSICKKSNDMDLYPLYSFKQLVSYAVYGDDNIVSVNDLIKDKFNLVILADFLKDYGVTLKNGADKDEEILSPFYPISKVDFLKRKFTVLQGHVVSPLNRINITERLHWVRKGMTEVDAIVENCQSAAFEAVFHGEHYYKDICGVIKKACTKNGITVDLPTFQDALNIHLSGGSFATAIQTMSLQLPKRINFLHKSYQCVNVFPDVYFVTNERNETVRRLLERTTIQNICYITRNYASKNNSQSFFTLSGEGWKMCSWEARYKVYSAMKRPVYFVDEANDGLAIAYALDYSYRIGDLAFSDLSKMAVALCGHRQTMCSNILDNFSALSTI